MSDRKLEDIIDGQFFPANNRYLLFSAFRNRGYGGFKNLILATNILEDLKKEAKRNNA